MLGRVTPEKCLFYLSWAGTASPDLTSPNQTEQLLAEPEVQNFLKQMRVGLRAAMIKSWPTPTVFAAEPLPPNGTAAWIAPFDFVYDILQCAATNPGAVFVTRKKPNDDATRTSPPGDKTESKTPSPDKVDKKSLVERLADEIDWGACSLSARRCGATGEARKAAEEEERTKSTIVPLDGDDWYCHFDERVFLAVRGGYLIVASCETTLTDTLARMKNEPPRWWTEVSQQLPIERRSVTIYADLHRR